MVLSPSQVFTLTFFDIKLIWAPLSTRAEYLSFSAPNYAISNGNNSGGSVLHNKKLDAPKLASGIKSYRLIFTKL